MDQSQYETPVQVISHRHRILWELEFVTINTQVTVSFGDDRIYMFPIPSVTKQG